jgi:hypothetical protein
VPASSSLSIAAVADQVGELGYPIRSNSPRPARSTGWGRLSGADGSAGVGEVALMVEGLGRSTSTRFLTTMDPGAEGCGSAGCWRRTPGLDVARSAVASATFATGLLGLSPKAVTRSVTKTPRDGVAAAGTDATLSPWRARRRVTGETDRMVWDGVRLAHNPEVAGSNPAPATNVVAGQRPFPTGSGPLAMCGP